MYLITAEGHPDFYCIDLWMVDFFHRLYKTAFWAPLSVEREREGVNKSSVSSKSPNSLGVLYTATVLSLIMALIDAYECFRLEETYV